MQLGNIHLEEYDTESSYNEQFYELLKIKSDLTNAKK